MKKSYYVIFSRALASHGLSTSMYLILHIVIGLDRILIIY